MIKRRRRERSKKTRTRSSRLWLLAPLACLLLVGGGVSCQPAGSQTLAVGRCATCQGTGKIGKRTCPTCGGLGYVRVQYSYPVIEPVK